MAGANSKRQSSGEQRAGYRRARITRPAMASTRMAAWQIPLDLSTAATLPGHTGMAQSGSKMASTEAASTATGVDAPTRVHSLTATSLVFCRFFIASYLETDRTRVEEDMKTEERWRRG